VPPLHLPGPLVQISALLFAVALGTLIFRRGAHRRTPVFFGAIALIAANWRSPAEWAGQVAACCAAVAAVQLFVQLVLQQRRNVPRIVDDLVLVGAYVAATIFLLGLAGVNLYGIITTSAVVTALIGLAMQETLANLLAGVSLQVEQSIREGDWIKVAEGSGIVRTVRLRHTLIETADSDHIVIPNQQLTRNPVTLISLQRRRLVPFMLRYGLPPTDVINIVESAMRAAPLLDCAVHPSPQVIVSTFHASHVEYGVFVWLLRPGRETAAISGVLTRVYYSLLRAGERMEAVAQTVELRNAGPDQNHESLLAQNVEMLRQVEMLRPCEPAELQELAGKLRQASFGPGEVVIRQNDAGDSLYFLAHGTVHVVVSHGPHLTEKVATLEAGDFFGEMSLMTGEPRSATVTAASAADCRILDKAAMESLLHRRPTLVEEISRVLTVRQQGLADAHHKLESEEQQRLRNEQEAGLIARIQKFFGLLEEPESGLT
jgi:small-conductance mechanosensitive channel/CRP-like cAMP-binding protein